MTKFEKNKDTILKLLEKYANSYNLVIEENKSLKQEIIDLRSNIKINKEIIDIFFNKKDKRSNDITKNFQEENKLLLAQNAKLSKERNELRTKLIQNSEIHQAAFNQIKQENSKNKTKLFLLEQELSRQNNIIFLIRKKLSKEHKDFYDNTTYILEPSKAVVQINNELLLYKEITDKLKVALLRKEKKSIKNEKIIEILKSENYKLKNKFKHQIKSVNRERETMLSFISSQNTRKSENKKSNYSRKIYSNNNNEDYRIYPAKFFKKCKNYSDTHEEFADILKNCGLTVKEFEKISKEKGLSKFTEVIELLFKMLTDKNQILNLLEDENENLISKNFHLNRENIELNAKIAKIQKSNVNTINENGNYNTFDETLSNNTSHITTNSCLNASSFITYQKFLEKQYQDTILSEKDLSKSFKESLSEGSYSLNGKDGHRCNSPHTPRNESIKKYSKNGNCNDNGNNVSFNIKDQKNELLNLRDGKNRGNNNIGTCFGNCNNEKNNSESLEGELEDIIKNIKNINNIEE